MMIRKIKYSKITIVIFLTVLIWVWADLALDETVSVPGAMITVAESSPELWINFDGKTSASIDNIVLKGPASKIADIKRELNDGSLAGNNYCRPVPPKRSGFYQKERRDERV